MNGYESKGRSNKRDHVDGWMGRAMDRNDKNHTQKCHHETHCANTNIKIN